MGSGNDDAQGLTTMPLGVEHEDVQPLTSVITLRGKLMLGEECAQLETLVPQLLKDGRKNLVFDLSGVTHIDSTGIGRFIDTFSRLMQIGGRLRFAQARGGGGGCLLWCGG